MGILKNPQIIIKSDVPESIASDMLEDIMSGNYVGMENVNEPIEIEVLYNTTIEEALADVDLSTIQVQYRHNNKSIPVLAEGTLELYSDASSPLRFSHCPLFKFIPTNPELYTDKAEYYLMDDVVKISVKLPQEEEKEES